MILKASQRGSGLQLARHLLRTDENEHVDIYELRGFVAEHSLANAFQEIIAIAKGTRCIQPFFSLSINPPEDEIVPIKVFEDAVVQIEKTLGLSDQPRAIVFHEKEGRRHAHVVWSRIDAENMKAINLPHFKLKLRDLSKELYLEHGWQLPEGYLDKSARDPMNLTLEEWQQAKRTKQDARALKTSFQECWSISDTRVSFERALEERGFFLAKGDRRGFVAVDYRGEVYALNRWTGRKRKELTERLGDPVSLPSVTQTKEMISKRMTGVLKRYIMESENNLHEKLASSLVKKVRMKERHMAEREKLQEQQALRWASETKARAKRFRRGLGAIWDWMTGKSNKIRHQNEREAYEGIKRDDAERDAQIVAQMSERRDLQTRIKAARRIHFKEKEQLYADVASYLRLAEKKTETGTSRQSDSEIERTILD